MAEWAATFNATFTEGDSNFAAVFSESDTTFGADFGEVVEIDSRSDPYTGDYTVTPSASSDIVLETRTKLMSDDVTVFEIPYDEVSNQYGTTVTIAS